MTDEIVESISDRYIELFEKITGEKFQKANTDQLEIRIEKAVIKQLK